MEEISSPQPTSETFFDGNATDNSIPDSAENVNRKEQKTETPNSALKRGAAVTEQSSLISSKSPVISITDFLQAVKDISAHYAIQSVSYFDARNKKQCITRNAKGSA